MSASVVNKDSSNNPPAVIIMSVWLLVPFNIILYTAGLQEVPRDLYDAAAVDGAAGKRDIVPGG